MTAVVKPELDAWVAAHTGGSLSGNRTLGIGGRVVRAFDGGGSPLVAVAGDAEFETQLHSLVDLLHWQHSGGLGSLPGRVVIGSGPKAAELRDAMGTLLGALGATATTVAILQGDGTLAAVADAPSYAAAGAKWATDLAIWDATEPDFRAAEFRAALDTIASHHANAVSIHPDLTAGTWSIRIDGLRVGRIHRSKPAPINLGVWKGAAAGQPAKDFANIAGAANVVTCSVADAATLVVKLADYWCTHPGGHGYPEHALESAILRGHLGVKTLAGDDLARVDTAARVLRAGQFPTLWSVQPKATARYLDVVMRVGPTPWAVELKKPTTGSEYRRAITQAVLYAAFIRQAEPLHGWFAHRGMDATTCRAAIVVPPGIVAKWRDPLLAIAARFGVAVAEVPPPPPYDA